MRRAPKLLPPPRIQLERDPLATIAGSAAPVVLEGRYRLLMRALWDLRNSRGTRRGLGLGSAAVKLDTVRPAGGMEGHAEDECQRSGERREVQEPPHSPRSARSPGLPPRFREQVGQIECDSVVRRSMVSRLPCVGRTHSPSIHTRSHQAQAGMRSPDSDACQILVRITL
jgi:hypothetical protein